MPSSLVSGPLQRFLRIGRKLTVEASAVLVLRPREVPSNPEPGTLYVDEDNNLVYFDGTDHRVVTLEAAA